MAKKKHKSVLPKRIAGVKVPKSVRKGPLGQLLASRTGQALIAEAIMAAGAVGVAKQANDNGDGHARRHDQQPNLGRAVVADALRRWQGAGRGKDADPIGATVAFALGEAARVFVKTLGEHRDGQARAADRDDEAVEAEWRARDDAPEGSKKNSEASEVHPR
jgi:hypothetical protein